MLTEAAETGANARHSRPESSGVIAHLTPVGAG